MRSTQSVSQSFYVKLIMTIYWVGALVNTAWYSVANWDSAPNGLLLVLYALVRSVLWPVWAIQAL